MFTKILHMKMDKVCEWGGLYGTTQYEFRKGRSTTNCVFMLLAAAIQKAKKKNHVLSIEFCNIAKAYNSVNRELLYAKLDPVNVL